MWSRRHRCENKAIYHCSIHPSSVRSFSSHSWRRTVDSHNKVTTDPRRVSFLVSLYFCRLLVTGMPECFYCRSGPQTVLFAAKRWWIRDISVVKVSAPRYLEVQENDQTNKMVGWISQSMERHNWLKQTCNKFAISLGWGKTWNIPWSLRLARPE